MKQLVTSKKSIESMQIKDSDWYRFLTRLEHQTHMKVVDGRWEKDRNYLILQDDQGNQFDVEIGHVTYYTFDSDNMYQINW